MNVSWRRAWAMVAVAVLALVPVVLVLVPEAGAQIEVVLMGKVLTAEEKGMVHTYSLSFKDQKLRYRVDQGFTPQHVMGSETIYDILSLLGPPRMRLVGEDKVLGPLLQPGVEGRHFRIEGLLYEAEKFLDVSTIEELKPRKKKSP